jgi:hypothetical protein
MDATLFQKEQQKKRGKHGGIIEVEFRLENATSSHKKNLLPLFAVVETWPIFPYVLNARKQFLNQMDASPSFSEPSSLRGGLVGLLREGIAIVNSSSDQRCSSFVERGRLGSRRAQIADRQRDGIHVSSHSVWSAGREFKGNLQKSEKWWLTKAPTPECW